MLQEVVAIQGGKREVKDACAPRLQAGINMWGLPGGVTWEEAVAEAAAHEFSGIEPNLETEGWITPKSTRRELAAKAKSARDAGLEIVGISTGLLWETSLTAPDAAERQAAGKTVRALLRTATAMDTDTVLVVPGAVDVFFQPKRPRVRYDLAMERLTAALEELLPAAEREGVNLALETVWNRFLLSPLEVRSLVDHFGSPRLKVYLDVGNIVQTGYPQDWVDILGGRIARVHVKGFRRCIGTAEGFCGILGGDIDWHEVVEALIRVGYEGFLTAELFKPSRIPWPLFLGETVRELRWVCGLAETMMQTEGKTRAPRTKRKTATKKTATKTKRRVTKARAAKQ